MKGDNTLTVTDSDHGFIPEGTTLTIHSNSTNQFTGRRTLTVSADAEIPNRASGDTFQLYQMPDMCVWREVHVGLDRAHEQVVVVIE